MKALSEDFVGVDRKYPADIDVSDILSLDISATEILPLIDKRIKEVEKGAEVTSYWHEVPRVHIMDFSRNLVEDNSINGNPVIFASSLQAVDYEFMVMYHIERKSFLFVDNRAMKSLLKKGDISSNTPLKYEVTIGMLEETGVEHWLVHLSSKQFFSTLGGPFIILLERLSIVNHNAKPTTITIKDRWKI